MITKIVWTFTLCLACLLPGCAPDNAPSDEAASDSSKVPVPAAPAPEAIAHEAQADSPAPVIDLATLALKIDPVCRMSLEEHPATDTAEHGGKNYGFCSSFCKKKFLEKPDELLARFAESAAPAADTATHSAPGGAPASPPQ